MVSPSSETPSQIEAEVMVETAHPDVVFDNLAIWKAAGMAAVVGTSGFTPDRLASLREMWGESGPPCLVVPNFSIGAVLMMRFAAQAAPHFEAVEIIERHHSDKPDAPSGTALASAMGIAGAGGSSAEKSQELAPGARGAAVEGVRVHSLRLPGLISQQEVALSNAGEVLSIEHLSTSYESFVGASRDRSPAARFTWASIRLATGRQRLASVRSGLHALSNSSRPIADVGRHQVGRRSRPAPR